MLGNLDSAFQGIEFPQSGTNYIFSDTSIFWRMPGTDNLEGDAAVFTEVP